MSCQLTAAARMMRAAADELVEPYVVMWMLANIMNNACDGLEFLHVALNFLTGAHENSQR